MITSLLSSTLIALAALSAAARDTAATKRELIAVTQRQTLAIQRGGIRALLSVSNEHTVLQFPGLETVVGPRRAGGIRRRYRDAVFTYATQHAIADANGLFGCTIGITRIHFAGDSASSTRPGRFAACWQRRRLTDGWTLRAFVHIGESADAPALEANLHGAPRSSSVVGGSDGRTALDADRAFARLAVDSGGAVAFTRYAAEDAMLLSARPHPRGGPAEIGAMFSAGGVMEIAWTPDRTTWFESGGLGITTGDGTVKSADGVSETKYLSIWRRDPDGHWRYVFDIGSDRPRER